MRRKTPFQLCWFLLSLFLGGCASFESETASNIDPFEKVNTGQPGRIITPVNQVLTPAGIQVELPKMRPQAIALSPDGNVLVTSGKTHDLVFVNPSTGDIIDDLSLPAGKSTNTTSEMVSSQILQPDKDAQLSFTGLIFSHDGKRIYLSNVNGDIKVFKQIAPGKYKPAFTIPLPKTKTKRKDEIPAGLALSADGKTLYVALNLSNQLMELDAESGRQLRVFDVGVAPYDVVITGGKAYVSNWGGRRPEPNDITGPAGRGTRVRVDPVRFIASEGSVSIIDLVAGKPLKEIVVGLHSSAMALSPNRRYLTIANAGSDSVSVLDTRTDTIIENISLQWQLGDPFGASPNALTFSPDGQTLYVCNGTQNAVATVAFKPGRSKITGLIPTGWFPGAIAFDKKRSRLHVANIKGFGSGKRWAPGDKEGFNSHQYFGSLSLIDVPGRSELAKIPPSRSKTCGAPSSKMPFCPPAPASRPACSGKGRGTVGF